MEQVVKKTSMVFWGNLTEEESNELVKLLNLMKTWRDAWGVVKSSHDRYGISYGGPSAFVPDEALRRIRELSDKGWGIEAYKKQVREEDRKAAEEGKG